MKYTNRFILFFFIALPFSVSASSVWKITNGDKSIFLAGTMHMLSADDYPLPDSYAAAYEASQELVFETDVSALTTPAFQQKSMQILTYTDGTTLDQVLSAETLRQLKAHLTKRGIPYSNLKTMKPTLISLTLTLIEFQLMGLTTEGVDSFYFSKAGLDGKTRTWLETPDQQLSFIANMAMDDEDEMILYTLNDIETMPERMGELKQAWRAGDMQTFIAVGLDSWINDYPELYNSILVQRNNNWMPKIEKMLNTQEVEMVLVGALHAPGEYGLLAQLAAKGYIIEQMK